MASHSQIPPYCSAMAPYITLIIETYMNQLHTKCRPSHTSILVTNPDPHFQQATFTAGQSKPSIRILLCVMSNQSEGTKRVQQRITKVHVAMLACVCASLLQAWFIQSLAISVSVSLPRKDLNIAIVFKGGQRQTHTSMSGHAPLQTSLCEQ